TKWKRRAARLFREFRLKLDVARAVSLLSRESSRLFSDRKTFPSAEGGRILGLLPKIRVPKWGGRLRPRRMPTSGHRRIDKAAKEQGRKDKEVAVFILNGLLVSQITRHQSPSAVASIFQ